VIDQPHQPIEGRQSVAAVEQPALTRAGEVRWELARVGGMRVPGAVFASEELLAYDVARLRPVVVVKG
jgi:hypothetical protein